jgi:hypothetical protein
MSYKPTFPARISYELLDAANKRRKLEDRKWNWLAEQFLLRYIKSGEKIFSDLDKLYSQKGKKDAT